MSRPQSSPPKPNFNWPKLDDAWAELIKHLWQPAAANIESDLGREIKLKMGEGEWRSFTDCDGNTFEVFTRNFKPGA